MRNFTDTLGIDGHLTIIKRFRDGEEEVVFDDHNIIVSGMGVGLSYMFAGSASQTVLNYQIDRFQLGLSGNASLENSTTGALSGPLSSIGEYGTGSNLFIEGANQIISGVLQEDKFFALIPANKVTRIDENSIRYTLVVDEEGAVNISRLNEDQYLSEVGLFMKNPTRSAAPNASILVAYRSFTKIQKTNDFSLIFRWTINF